MAYQAETLISFGVLYLIKKEIWAIRPNQFILLPYS